MMSKLRLGSRARLGLRAAAAFALVVFFAPTTRAAFTQATCSPWVGNGPVIPVDLGASDFNTAWNDATTYGDTESYPWKVLVNSNVRLVNFGYANFDTEYSYDRLTVDHSGGTLTLTGTLGTSNTGTLSPLGSTYQKHFIVGWHSDSSVARQSIPRLSTAQPTCWYSAYPTQSNMPLLVNERYDGILIATGDVIYTTVTQPANTRMYLTLDALASDVANVDLDLYASTSAAYPDDSSYTWRGYSGNTTNDTTTGGEALDLGTTGSSPRTVYIGVHSYRGAAHFLLRANVAKSSGGVKAITICHPGVSNIQNHANWPNARETIERTMLRMIAATHGNVFPASVTMKYSSGTGGDKWRSSLSCDWCMPHTSIADYCGFQSQTPGRTRIPNVNCAGGTSPGDYDAPELLSLILAHEMAHGQFGFDDEYGGGGGFCGHSIMNGPQNWTYRFCKPINHCLDGAPGSWVPAGKDCSSAGSNWYKIVYSSYNQLFYTTPALYDQSSQPWERFHANRYARNLITFSYQ